MKNKKPHGRRNGVALITTLFLLSVFAILVVGFLDSMRTESSASDAIENAQRAKLVAQGAVAHAIDILRTNIPDPAQISEAAGNLRIRQPDRLKNTEEVPRPFEFGRTNVKVARAEHWVTNPGRLTLLDESGQHIYVDLHTGAVDGAPGGADLDDTSIDLNAPLAGKTVPAIVPAERGSSRPEMRVQFVNVLENPGEAADPDNKIIARYAFWLDDETAKLNFNVACGKPAASEDRNFHEQLNGGMVTPYFFRGTGETRPDGSGSNNRHWSLGHPRSINLDVLFRSPGELRHDDLLDHVWVHGFHRYPEAILKYVNLGRRAGRWFDENKFNLTFYSRAPEFNVFGRSRLFTTRHPLSLEAGPLYQQVFMHDPDGAGIGNSGNEVLNLHSLMGAFGWHDFIEDPTGELQAAPNMINRLQLEMLMRYMNRKFPGFERSFVDKYGLEGCLQISLNMLNMARFATTYMGSKIDWFSVDWSLRTTSVSYIPASTEGRGQVEMRYDGSGEEHRHAKRPEDSYWRFRIPGVSGTGRNGETLMIPQSPGPHITEFGIQFRVRPVYTRRPVRNNRKTGKLVLKKWDESDAAENRGRRPPAAIPRQVEFRIVGELTATPQQPVIKAQEFILQVDRLVIEVDGTGMQQLRPNGEPWLTTAGENQRSYTGKGVLDIGKFNVKGSMNTTDWNKITSFARIRALPQRRHFVGGPETSAGSGQSVTDELHGQFTQRHRFASSWRPLGEREFEVPAYFRVIENGEIVRDEKGNAVFNYNQWRPMIFDARKGRYATIKTVKIRAGLTVSHSRRRPRQMMPLGERETDVLEWRPRGRGARINLMETDAAGDLLEQGAQSGVYWEISDPNLSALQDQWVRNPGNGASDHSLGKINALAREPVNESSEKSKFKYIQHGYNNARWRTHSLNSGDEYRSKSRTSSKGFWSLIHTGLQGNRGIPWRTMDLGPSGRQDSPPDWLLLNIFGATYPMQHQQWRNDKTLPDEFSTVSFMNSTFGQVNLNTRIYPRSSSFNVPDRSKPLEGVFCHLRRESDVHRFVQNVISYQKDKEVFEYIGELSDVPGYGGGKKTTFERESFLRNMAGCLTINSNTFGMWGVAQTVRKSRANHNSGEFERGDQVTGQKRFFAILERYVWPGKDGVPGNAHVDNRGRWDRIAKQNREIGHDSDTDRLFGLPGSPPLRRSGLEQTGTRLLIDKEGVYPEYDGPQPVGMESFTREMLGDAVWSHSPLEEAYNPPQAVVKYRVVYFKYLDE